MPISINLVECIGCGTCITFCPVNALSLPGEIFKTQVDGELCNECLICVDHCPLGAIEGV